MMPFTKRCFLFCCCLVLLLAGNAQTVTTLRLQDCYSLAAKNYPLAAQKALIDSTNKLTIQNLNHNYLPEIDLNAQATYQSEVTSLPIKIPNVNLPALDKDQYKAAININQVIYDGKTTYFLKQQQIINDVIRKQQVDVQLYQIKNMVNQYYFNILLMQERETLIGVEMQDINSQLHRMEVAVANGAEIQVNADILKAQLLTLDQQLSETRSDRAQALKGLGMLLKQDLNVNVNLEKPLVEHYPFNGSIESRPEEALYASQAKQADIMLQSVDSRYHPKFGFFGEGGYGRPGLNMLTNSFSPYAIGGVKVTWNLWNWGSARNEKSIWTLNKDMVLRQKETFELNTDIQLQQESEEIDKVKDLITKDDAIILTRARIVEKVVSQLNNGVITATDYLVQIDARTTAELNKKVHELQLILARVNYITIAGDNIQ